MKGDIGAIGGILGRYERELTALKRAKFTDAKSMAAIDELRKEVVRLQSVVSEAFRSNSARSDQHQATVDAIWHAIDNGEAADGIGSLEKLAARLIVKELGTKKN
jgi:hypothetical protein